MKKSSSLLPDIHRLQTVDLARAEEMALDWLNNEVGFKADSVSLNPQPTSLNSINGIATTNQERFFFKSHTEDNTEISEYYNADLLADAGYNTVKPLFREKEIGKQVAIYPVINWPVMFDVMGEIEQGTAPKMGDLVLEVEKRECKRLLEIYEKTAKQSNAGQNAGAPVHQLFWHRLKGGRFDQFYKDSSIAIPDGQTISTYEIFSYSWTINGVVQPRTLSELITEATSVLEPNQEALTVIGHGDAHFGNVFLEDSKKYLYFDPAFAGRHSPLLDVTKPLFHNVFAQWMYFPHEQSAEITIEIGNKNIAVDYSNAFAPIRQSLLEIKQRELLDPLQRWLKRKGSFTNRRPLELALMCCPLLTKNLCDSQRFPPEISWLGFALSLQMGNWDEEQDFAFV